MTKWMPIRIAAVLGTAVVAAVVTLLVTGGPVASEPTAAQAWIDDPLSGEILPLGAVAVLAHAHDSDGVAEMTLSVDGVIHEVAVPDEAGDVLTHVEWSWLPPGPGVYVLEVVGRDSAGSVGVPARAVVEVVAEVGVDGDTTTTTAATTTTTTSPPTTTTTTAPATTTTTAPPTTTTTTAPATTTTTTPPTTTTTTAPPCTPPPPVLLSPSDGSTFIGPNPTIGLDWSGWRGLPPQCLPSGFVARVATDPGLTTVVAEASFAPSVTAWTPRPTSWSCNLSHYWAVWSIRSDGSLASPSATWRIDVICVG